LTLEEREIYEYKGWIGALSKENVKEKDTIKSQLIGSMNLDIFLHGRLSLISNKLKPLADNPSEYYQKLAKEMIEIHGYGKESGMTTTQTIEAVKSLPKYIIRPQEFCLDSIKGLYGIKISFISGPDLVKGDPEGLYSLTWLNKTKNTMKQILKITRKTINTTATTTTKTNMHKWDVKIGYKVKVEAGGKFLGIGVKNELEQYGEAAYGGSITNEVGTTVTETIEKTWEEDSEITISPNKSTVAKLILNKGTLVGAFRTIIKPYKIDALEIINEKEENITLKGEALGEYMDQVVKIMDMPFIDNHILCIGGYESHTETEETDLE